MPGPAQPPSRFGAFTSVINPEIESLRQFLNEVMAANPQPQIIARSRTGQLYPSEVGTPAEAAKGFARGFGGEALNQAENFTSPAAIATGALGSGIGNRLTSAGINGVGAGAGAIGRGVEKAATALDIPAKYVGLYELLQSPVKGGATLAAPYVARAGARGMQKLGAFLRSVTPDDVARPARWLTEDPLWQDQVGRPRE